METSQSIIDFKFVPGNAENMAIYEFSDAILAA